MIGVCATDDVDYAGKEPDRSAAVILEHLGIGAALVDSRGTVLFRNDLFEALLGSDAACLAIASARRGAEGCETVHGNAPDLRLRMRRIGTGMLVTVEEADSRGLAADRDLLTGAHTREGLRTAFDAMRMAGESSATVIAVNLDRFRPVNEALGYGVGNELLKSASARIKSVLQPGDLLARLGGDDFVIVVRGETQPGRAASLAGRLIDLLARSYIVSGHLVIVGASAGIALAGEHETMDSLIRNAELALSRVKRDGGNGYQFFEAEMHARLLARRDLETDLRRALALRQFEVHYQPQVNLETGHLTGFEALLRWRHPARGLVSPADFIPVVEELNLIVPIGEWVLRTACLEAAHWPNDMRIAVNVSAVQLRGPALVRTVMSALAESGLRSDRLELEVTESVLVESEGGAVETLHNLRALGVRISMDDFGTGYASLSYLRSFPFDKIKIDQSFVRGEDAETSGSMIVRAVAALGRSLGMTTLAEGVETAEQMERIRAGGCTDIQGYLIARPMPASEIGPFITTRESAVPRVPSLRG